MKLFSTAYRNKELTKYDEYCVYLKLGIKKAIEDSYKNHLFEEYSTVVKNIKKFLNENKAYCELESFDVSFDEGINKKYIKTYFRFIVDTNHNDKTKYIDEMEIYEICVS